MIKNHFSLVRGVLWGLGENSHYCVRITLKLERGGKYEAAYFCFEANSSNTSKLLFATSEINEKAIGLAACKMFDFT